MFIDVHQHVKLNLHANVHIDVQFSRIPLLAILSQWASAPNAAKVVFKHEKKVHLEVFNDLGCVLRWLYVFDILIFPVIKVVYSPKYMSLSFSRNLFVSSGKAIFSYQFNSTIHIHTHKYTKHSDTHTHTKRIKQTIMHNLTRSFKIQQLQLGIWEKVKWLSAL